MITLSLQRYFLPPAKFALEQEQQEIDEKIRMAQSEHEDFLSRARFAASSNIYSCCPATEIGLPAASVRKYTLS
jgi:hypothetical protein